MAKKHAEEAVEGSEATVYNTTGGVIRVYSKEMHGDTFMDAAKEMAAQHPGSTIEVR